MHVSLSQHYSCYCRSCQPDLSTAASVSLCPQALLTSNQGLCYMLQSTQPQLWSAKGYAVWSLTASSDLIFPYSSYLHSTKAESWPDCCSSYSPGPGPSYSQSLLGMLVLSKAGFECPPWRSSLHPILGGLFLPVQPEKAFHTYMSTHFCGPQTIDCHQCLARAVTAAPRTGSAACCISPNGHWEK